MLESTWNDTENLIKQQQTVPDSDERMWNVCSEKIPTSTRSHTAIAPSTQQLMWKFDVTFQQLDSIPLMNSQKRKKIGEIKLY